MARKPATSSADAHTDVAPPRVIFISRVLYIMRDVPPHHFRSAGSLSSVGFIPFFCCAHPHVKWCCSRFEDVSTWKPIQQIGARQRCLFIAPILSRQAADADKVPFKFHNQYVRFYNLVSISNMPP